MKCIYVTCKKKHRFVSSRIATHCLLHLQEIASHDEKAERQQPFLAAVPNLGLDAGSSNPNQRQNATIQGAVADVDEKIDKTLTVQVGNNRPPTRRFGAIVGG